LTHPVVILCTVSETSDERCLVDAQVSV